MRKKLLIAATGGSALLLATAGPAAAQDMVSQDELEALTAQLSNNIDNVFILICSALVIFMQAGFALVEAGLTRAKNAAHMMLKNILDFTLGALGFAFVGYHLAYSGAAFIGFEWLWQGPTAPAPGAPNLTTPTHFLFNMAFAAAASTIVSGAVAERVKFRAYFIYAIVISSFIYPIVVNWVWGGGWLSQLDTPFIDFAGGTVVHATGGMCALMGAKIAGPRIGRYSADGTANPIPGHNIPLAITGVFILLIGWFGFNAGSTLGADVSIGSVATATALGGAAGAIGALATSILTVKNPDVTLVGNGLLGGLVSITAGALNLSPFGAIATGFIGGIIATVGVLALDRYRIDDPVGAIPVHLLAGIWGAIAVGLLASPDQIPGGNGPRGFLYGGSIAQLGSQILGIVSIVSFVAIASGTLFLVMRESGQLRVTEAEEMIGMDIAEHATPAYNDDYVADEEYLASTPDDLSSLTSDDWLEGSR